MSVHALLIGFGWVLAAVGVGVHAMDHDRSPFLWGILTMLTGLIGVAIYAVVMGTQLDDPNREDDVLVCPNCSARHPKEPKFCSECGEALKGEAAAPTASVLRSGAEAFCGNCHSQVEIDAEECPSCGSIF